MKKTSVLICALPILLVGCYSTPEFNETQVKHCQYKTTIGCDPENFYQNAAFRECVEETAYLNQKNKKTVVFGETADGTSLVIPYAAGVEEMSDPNMVYPVVDVRETAENAEVIVMNEAATEEDMSVQEKVVVETETIKEKASQEEQVKTALSGELKAIEPGTEDELKKLPETGNPNQASSFNLEVNVEEEVIAEEPSIKIEEVSTGDVNSSTVEELEITEDTENLEPVSDTETNSIINNEKEILPLEEK